MLLFYNKDLFDEAGLAHPTDDWTRETLLEAAKALTRRDKLGRITQVGILPYTPYSWVWSAGGRFSDDAMGATYFSDPKTIDALEFFEGLRNRWHVSTRNMSVSGGDPSAVDLFQKGNVAMAISGPWMLSTYMGIRDFEWDIALFPKGPAGRQTRYAGGGFVIASTCRHKKEAWELLKYLTGTEVGISLGEEFTDIPARRSVAYDVFANRKVPFDIGVMLKSMEPGHGRIRIFPRNERWPYVDRLFSEEFSGALVGDKTVREAMQATDRRAKRYLAEKRARDGEHAGIGDYIALAAILLAAGVAGRRYAGRHRHAESTP
jgi:multiple sugar transport system substrate-binding protein